MCVCWFFAFFFSKSTGRPKTLLWQQKFNLVQKLILGELQLAFQDQTLILNSHLSIKIEMCEHCLGWHKPLLFTRRVEICCATLFLEGKNSCMQKRTGKAGPEPWKVAKVSIHTPYQINCYCFSTLYNLMLRFCPNCWLKWHLWFKALQFLKNIFRHFVVCVFPMWKTFWLKNIEKLLGHKLVFWCAHLPCP